MINVLSPLAERGSILSQSLCSLTIHSVFEVTVTDIVPGSALTCANSGFAII